tara:strand:+ start:756 stop:950 length:195 start_codon:yes stop_codon:yes gene_type:complete
MMTQKQKEYFIESEREMLNALIPTLEGNSTQEMRNNLFAMLKIHYHDEDEVDYLINEYLADSMP